MLCLVGMKKYIPEILKEINSDSSKIKDYEEKKPILSLLFKYAFDPEYKFLLPDGDPPFEPNPHNIGLNGLLTAEIKKLYVYTKENPNMESFRREMHFVDLLKDIHVDEVKVLLAVKDQNLGKLYPKITEQFIKDSGFYGHEN